jgi:hypothetical protein
MFMIRMAANGWVAEGVVSLHMVDVNLVHAENIFRLVDEPFGRGGRQKYDVARKGRQKARKPFKGKLQGRSAADMNIGSVNDPHSGTHTGDCFCS